MRFLDNVDGVLLRPKLTVLRWIDVTVLSFVRLVLLLGYSCFINVISHCKHNTCTLISCEGVG